MYERGISLGIALIAIVMVAGVAGATIYKNYQPPQTMDEHAVAPGEGGAFRKSSSGKNAPSEPNNQTLPWHDQNPQPAPRAERIPVAKPACNDGNILGYAAGGVAGGVLGNQIGKGKGNAAATIGGVLGGAYLGGQHIPLQNATCRR